jgi:3-oxoacyl-(acyl-carrier-protein) synthase
MPEHTQFAYMAARQAFNQAGMDSDYLEKNEVGCIFGSDSSAKAVLETYKTMENEHDTAMLGYGMVFQSMNSTVTMNLSTIFHLKGVNFTVSAACASGSHSIGLGYMMIKQGLQDIVLCGGAQETNYYSMSSFDALGVFSIRHQEPQKASRPFDKDRDGFVMGEGATILILEEYEHAKKRGAKIYAELAGYGATTDGYHLTAPNPDGVEGARAMTLALEDAKMKPEDVVYYNAHGTSTHKNDSGETQMLKNAFGDYAYKLHISSTKSMTGHCLGNAGSLEAFVCVKAIQEGFIPPTINLDNPDVEGGCDLDYTPNKGLKIDVPVAMSGNFGFGGHNGIVVFKKVSE